MCERGRAERRERIPSRLSTVSTEPNVGLNAKNGEIMPSQSQESDAYPTEPARHPPVNKHLYSKF